MNLRIGILATAVAVTCLTQASAQVATSLVVPLENEPPPSLVLSPPLPGPLANGVAFIPYRVQNLRIMPLGSPAAKNLSPRVGHLHITLDDAPWSWADYGNSDTIILINLPRGEHKVLVEVVDPEGGVLTSQTLKFLSPGKK